MAQKKILVLTEKPKVAQSIAQALGGMQRHNGYFENNDYIVTWAFGHLLGLYDAEDYDPDYARWRFEDLPIIPSRFQYKLLPDKGVKQHFRVIEQLFRRPDVSAVCNACDAGREGELIFRTIYQFVGSNLPILRLWISSQTAQAIRQGMNNLRPGSEFDLLADEAFSRQEADWLVGINATRAYSTKNRAKIPIGRVQTPTLALVVQRELAIRSFQPEPYYRIKALFETSEGLGYVGWWYRGEEKSVPTKEEAEQIAALVAANEGEVTDVQEEEKEEKHPLLFDLTSLQQEMNRRYGFSAAKTLDLAQELYETHKLITYPRTDSRYLSGDLISQLRAAVEASADLLPAEAQPILDMAKLPITGRIVNDAKVTDHHAIIPTGHRMDLGQLSDDERKVYDAIVRRFLSAFYPPYRYRETVVTTEVAGETFRTRGIEPIDEGWRVLYQNDTQPEEDHEDDSDFDAIPPLEVGETVLVMDVETVERLTQPPKRYTEATLLADMERVGKFLEDEAMKEAVKARGLGTPATRADIIEKLIKHGYLLRRGRTLYPTDKGVALIEGLSHELLKSPELTAEWEMKLASIREGKMSREEFMKEIKALTREIVHHATYHGDIPNIHAGAGIDENLGDCPVCGKKVKMYQKAYTCGNRDCTFVIWRWVSGKQITPNIARQLIRDGQTGFLKGFKSKRTGKEFNARLRLNAEGRVELDFEKAEAK